MHLFDMDSQTCSALTCSPTLETLVAVFVSHHSLALLYRFNCITPFLCLFPFLFVSCSLDYDLSPLEAILGCYVGIHKVPLDFNYQFLPVPWCTRVSCSWFPCGFYLLQPTKSNLLVVRSLGMRMTCPNVSKLHLWTFGRIVLILNAFPTYHLFFCFSSISPRSGGWFCELRIYL